MPAGTHLRLEVTNEGTMAHDLKLGGTKGTDLLQPGASATADLGVVTASGQAWCTVPGHKEAGMVLNIAVTGKAPGPATGDTGTSKDAKVDVNATPWQGGTPTTPR